MNVLPAGLDIRRRKRVRSLYPFVLAITAGVLGAVLCLSALLDLTDGADAFWALASCGVILLGIGLVGIRNIGPQRRPSRTLALNAVVLAFVWSAMLGAVIYLVTGVTERFDDALFEAMAGFTTTNLSAIDLTDAPRGVVFWRAATQWFGALGAVVFAIGVIPTLGRGRKENLAYRIDAPALAPVFRTGATRVLAIYGTLTLALGVAYTAAGTGVFDGVVLALSTASTGGFVPHAGSLAWYNSAAVEWIAALGMLAAGASFAVFWWLWKGAVQPLLRSVELRVYLLLALGSTLAITVWTWQDTGGGTTSVRSAAVTTTSAMSTTGFTIADWGDWDFSAQTLILMLIGIGTMAGAAGGGFRVLRLVEAVKLARQDLVQELHPPAVTVVRIDGVSIGEAAIERLHSYMVLALATIGVGAVVIALTGVDILTAITGSVSAFATMGPALGDLSGPPDAHEIDAAARFMLMPGMLFGRLSIYPVLLAAGSVGVWFRKTVGR